MPNPPNCTATRAIAIKLGLLENPEAARSPSCREISDGAGNVVAYEVEDPNSGAGMTVPADEYQKTNVCVVLVSSIIQDRQKASPMSDLFALGLRFLREKIIEPAVEHLEEVERAIAGGVRTFELIARSDTAAKALSTSPRGLEGGAREFVSPILHRDGLASLLADTSLRVLPLFTTGASPIVVIPAGLALALGESGDVGGRGSSGTLRELVPVAEGYRVYAGSILPGGATRTAVVGSSLVDSGGDRTIGGEGVGLVIALSGQRCLFGRQLTLRPDNGGEGLLLASLVSEDGARIAVVYNRRASGVAEPWVASDETENPFASGMTRPQGDHSEGFPAARRVGGRRVGPHLDVLGNHGPRQTASLGQPLAGPIAADASGEAAVLTAQYGAGLAPRSLNNEDGRSGGTAGGGASETLDGEHDRVELANLEGNSSRNGNRDDAPKEELA